MEDIQIEEGNIMTLAQYAYKYGAEGLLVTNWGDLGHLPCITMSLYGLILGVAVSWCKDTKACSEFRQEVSMRVFGNREMIDLNEKISEIKPVLNWYKAVTKGEEQKYFESNDYQAAIDKLQDLKSQAESLPFCSDVVKREVLAALSGYLLIAQICAKIDGHTSVDCGVDCEVWCGEYAKLWLLKNKRSELDEVIRVIKERMSDKV